MGDNEKMQRQLKAAENRARKNEPARRQEVDDKVLDVMAILDVHMRDDQYRAVPLNRALRVLEVAARKLNEAVELAHRYRDDFGSWPDEEKLRR